MPKVRLRAFIRFVLVCTCLVAACTAISSAFGVELRTEEGIRARWQQLQPTYGGSPYLVTPSWTSPYAAGSLRDEFLKDGLNAINYARYVAGLPDDVTLDPGHTSSAQCGAVLLAAGEFAHWQPKPPDMDDAFYQIAVTATSSSNIGWGYDTLWRFNLWGLNDNDSGNIDRVGHRRWLLDPQMLCTGMGYASGRSDTFAFDTSRTPRLAYDIVRWPSAGPFPVELFGASVPWSVTLDPAMYAWTPGTEGHTVVLRRVRDGKTWTFTSADTDKNGEYFNFDTAGYGVPDCFIFRPDPASVGAYEPGDAYEVTLSGGITRKADGTPVVISYTTRFITQAPVETPAPVATSLSLAGPSVAPAYKGSARLSALLKTCAGSVVRYQAVVFERWTGTRWLSVGTAATNYQGVAVKYAGPLTSRQTYRARFVGGPTFGSSTSPLIRVSPKAYLSNPIAPTYAPRIRSFTVFGYLKPHHTARSYPVRIYRWRYVSGAWRAYGYVRAMALDYSSYTRYVTSMSLSYRGKWRLRAYAPADSGHAATWSNGYEYVVVR